MNIRELCAIDVVQSHQIHIANSSLSDISGLKHKQLTSILERICTMARRENGEQGEQGFPLEGYDLNNLPSVSHIIKAKDAGEIIYKVEDVANRNLVLVSASLEVGNFGTYAKMTVFDPATKEEKIVTSGSALIMTQANTLIVNNVFPCRVRFTKQGKTWIMQ